ncbi:MAG: hypothetical protein ACW99G_11280 [Candidatus Thorarchaeota archaeon]|jgi:hypothetical protein
MAEHKIKELLTHYHGWLGYEPAWGKELKGAKRIVDKEHTIEEVKSCYEHFKAQSFWKDKHLSLQYIASNISAWQRTHQLNRPKAEVDPFLDKWFRENN